MSIFNLKQVNTLKDNILFLYHMLLDIKVSCIVYNHNHIYLTSCASVCLCMCFCVIVICSHTVCIIHIETSHIFIVGISLNSVVVGAYVAIRHCCGWCADVRVCVC